MESQTEDLKTIEVHQSLHLNLQKDDSVAVRQALVNAACEPWRHSAEKEREFWGLDEDTMREFLAFQRGEGDGFEETRVWLLPCQHGFKKVCVAPTNGERYTIRQHNLAFQDFVKKIVNSAAESADFVVCLGSDAQKPEDWLSAKAAVALRYFSSTSTRSFRNTQSCDWQLWKNFVIAATPGLKTKQYDLIGRWLVEAEGWDESTAYDLAIELMRQVDLLRTYDQKKSHP